jgi:drug/metabolite transporter (DMT)-like permease
MDRSTVLKPAGIWPTAALFAAAGVAGFNWLPLRYIAGQGLQSAWAGLALAIVSLAILLPFLPWRGNWDRRLIASILYSGLLNGGALGLYCASMLLTDVVRTLLLFYVAPMWGALLSRFVLGEKLSPARLAAIAMCIGGMLAILGDEHGLPWPHNAGDWLALLSGIIFAYGSLRVYEAPAVSAKAQTASTMAGCIAVSAFVLLILPSSLAGAVPALSGKLLLSLLVYALAMILPINWLWLWSAKYLPPSRVSLIFSLEAVVGIVTAALLAGEPFGWREAIGSVLVVGSTVVDVVGHRVPAPPHSPP